VNNQLWSWVLTIVGVTGFILAGKKIWWAWYINIACQGLWMAYAIVTRQWGFIAAAIVYTGVFTNNAIKWTRDRHRPLYTEVINLDHIRDAYKNPGKHRKPEIIYFEHSNTLWKE
jgi:hypothetical protein